MAAVPLLGIIMVINEKGGHKLVFGYPPDPTPLSVRDSGGGRPGLEIAPKGPTISTPAYSPFHEPFGYDAQFLADLMTPKARIVDRKFLLTVDDLTFLGHPASLLKPSTRPGGLSSYGDMISDARTTEAPIALFHIALVMQTSSTYPLRELFDFLHGQVLQPLVTALMHEQHRTSYVTQQIEHMVSVQEEMVGQARGEPSSTDSARTIVDRLLETSELARLLETLYNLLISGSSGRIDVNGWVGVPIRPFPHPELVRKPLDPFQPISTLGAAPKPSPFVPLRLYDTLLLLSTVNDLLDSLPLDASQPLRQLVQICSPTKSFQDLQSELDISIGLLFRMAAHLVAWGKARIIHQVTAYNVYAVSSSASLDPSSPGWLEFPKHFENFSLVSTLSQFGSNKSLKDLMPVEPASRAEFMQIVVWLLRNDFLEERFLYLFVVDQVDKTVSRTTSDSELLDRLTRGKAEAQAALFRRLFPYFGSKYHVDEMLWCEGLTRTHLQSMLSAFSNVLILCWA